MKTEVDLNPRRDRANLLILARATAKRVSALTHTERQRTKLCIEILSGGVRTEFLASFAAAIANLPIDERHYWIGTFYTLLLSPEVRKSQATYFTPPNLAELVIDLSIEAGFDVTRHDVLDPAAGGAAFLSTLAARAKEVGADPVEASYRLNGIEIDRGLAALSRKLISDRLGAKTPRGMIVTGDALRMKIPAAYDLVIANPPYGRIPEYEASDLAWSEVCYRGHINKYALFVELCVRHAKPNGIVALVIPSSFRAGPLFGRLREYIRERTQILGVGTVVQRSRLFVDVAQDISVLILRKGSPHQASSSVKFYTIAASHSSQEHARLPSDPIGAWSLPSFDDECPGGYTLQDWGVQVRSGYFVWNREPSRLVASPDGHCAFPLVWAKNVKPGAVCRPEGKDGKGTDFVTFEKSSGAIIRSPAVVLQRTTNDKQARRIRSAVMDPKVVKQWGGFTTENHTIVLTISCQKKAELLCKLLNTKEVDRRYRKVSGTATISVGLLRKLDLPSPEEFSRALKECSGDAEMAAQRAYNAEITMVC